VTCQSNVLVGATGPKKKLALARNTDGLTQPRRQNVWQRCWWVGRGGARSLWKWFCEEEALGKSKGDLTHTAKAT
jgi:hypothetical protein